MTRTRLVSILTRIHRFRNQKNCKILIYCTVTGSKEFETSETINNPTLLSRNYPCICSLSYSVIRERGADKNTLSPRKRLRRDQDLTRISPHELLINYSYILYFKRIRRWLGSFMIYNPKLFCGFLMIPHCPRSNTHSFMVILFSKQNQETVNGGRGGGCRFVSGYLAVFTAMRVFIIYVCDQVRVRVV